MKPRIFSAMQPSGNLHIGNYLGALKSWVQIQYDYETIFGIVDLHAITAYQDPAELRRKIEETAAIYIACGIDPKHCAIFVQSAVPAHVELAWVLTCVTPVGWLTRMTQFKAKAGANIAANADLPRLPRGLKGPGFHLARPTKPSAAAAGTADLPGPTGRLKGPGFRVAQQMKQPESLDDQKSRGWRGVQPMESVGAGILMYPVLMAADILLYNAAIVPVGEDQAQHLELTRDIAQRFNATYGETFVLPQTKLPAVGARVMGLDDPTAKMSKSAPGSMHAVALLDPPERIRKVIGRATTDTKPAIDFADLGAGVANLLGIFQAFSGWTGDQMRQHFTGMRYAGLKKEVAESVIAALEPIQQRYGEITADPGYLRSVLRAGAEKVAPIANATVERVKQRTGLYA